MPTLEPMGIGVYEENKGATDLAKKPLSLSYSKHIDVRHHFLSEMAANVTFHRSIFILKISMPISRGKLFSSRSYYLIVGALFSF